MADLNYDVSVSTTQAEASLSRLQKTVGGLNDTFIRLKSTLATISLGAVISQSLQFADAISDLSDASEIAIGNIIGFQNAVMASGGSAEGAQKAILKLVNSIGEAADGSASMQQAFLDVGVTIDDLRTLSNQDILSKTINGLDKITDSAKRSTLVTQLLGKEFRNVAAGQLGAAYAEATAKSQQYADAIAKGAAAQQNIDKTLGEFKIGLLEAIKPFTELISKVNIGVENFQRFVQALLAVGVALASLSIAGRVIAFFRVLIVSAGEIAAAFSSAGSMFVNLFRNFSSFIANAQASTGVLRGLWTTISAVAAELATALAPAFTALKAIAVPVLATIAGYWGWIQDSTSGAIDKLREYASALTFGMISPPGVQGGRGNGQAELDQRKKDADEAAKKEKELRDILSRQAEARAKVALELKHQVENMAIGLTRQTESIALEARLIELSKLRNFLSEDQVEIIKAQDDANVQRLAKLKDIEQQQEKLRFQLKFAKDEDKTGIEAQIGANEQLRKTVEEYYKKHNDSLDYNITQLQTARKLDAARLQDMENMKKAIEDQISRQQALGDILRGANDQAQSARNQVPASQLVGLSSIEKQIVDIQEKARLAAIEAARAFAANFEDGGDGLTPERARELADGLDQIANAYKGVAVAQTDVAKANYETSRSFSTGWQESFAKYAEDAQDASKQAATYFERFTQGFEDAIVSLVTNGKFSFKDFANSIIADFARIEARKMMTSFMGAGGSGGGSVLGSLFNFGKSLFGFANGGSLMAGMPAIVGERGPELFVPSSAGKIIANNKMGGGQAQVINNAVTYQIQAVDAASFRQLVAREPSFIYAVTEQGRRSQPSRRNA